MKLEEFLDREIKDPPKGDPDEEFNSLLGDEVETYKKLVEANENI